jgi:hypothetical protein
MSDAQTQISTESLQNMGLLDVETTPVRVIPGGQPIPTSEATVIGNQAETVVTELVETEEVACPDWLRGPDTTSAYTVDLYSVKCLKCPMLISTASSRNMRSDIPECHVQFGNPKCTAGTMQITLTGKSQSKVDDLVRKVERARSSGDPDLVQLAMTHVFEQCESVKRAVMGRVGLI